MTWPRDLTIAYRSGPSAVASDGIEGALKQVAELMGDVAEAAREQSSGIDQLNQAALTPMETVTQRNANQIEELTAQALPGVSSAFPG